MYAFEDPEVGNMLPESLGAFRHNVFGTADELFCKLDACFSGDSSIGPRTPAG